MSDKPEILNVDFNSMTTHPWKINLLKQTTLHEAMNPETANKHLYNDLKSLVHFCSRLKLIRRFPSTAALK